MKRLRDTDGDGYDGIDLDRYPFIQLPGAEEWTWYYEQGSQLAKEFPNQDCKDLCSALGNNEELAILHDALIHDVTMIQQGKRDGGNWIWQVVLIEDQRLKRFIIEGWCDYTGWDCQSGVHIEEVAP
jgi:hypothetical protein